MPLAMLEFNLGLFDTRLALILTSFLIPFCTWLRMGCFRSIPFELEECALMAGVPLGSLPVAIMYSFFVEYYVSGLTGPVKE